MSRVMRRSRIAAAWLWKHTAAGIAVLLIIAALIAGYRMGRLTAEPDMKVAQTQAADHDHSHTQHEPQMYTCAMHPSVRLPNPNAKCPICHMDLIPVIDGGSHDDNERRITLGEYAAEMSRIETVPVARFFPTAEARLYGEVTYDETSVARLTAYFPARIDRLFVNYVGVPVTKGDHIAEVYSPDLLAAFEELRQAVAASESSSSMRDIVRSATRDTLIAAREKLRLYGLTKEQIGAVERWAVDSDHLTMYAPIGGVVTHLAVREGDYVAEGAPIATVADLSRLWLDLHAYESQLPLLRWGQRVSFSVEAHPGEVFEGRISFIEPMINERTRTAAVRVAVDNSDRRLKPGMFASAVVRPRIAEDGAVISDELAGRWVCPMHPSIIKDGPGQCDVCGMDLGPAESLGMVGDSTTVVEPLVVPRSAVLFTGKRSIVYVAVPDADRSTYESREVVIGSRAGDFYIVRDGVREGEQVVVNGAFRVDSAMQIAAKPSMMMPSGGASGSTHAGHGMMGMTMPETTGQAGTSDVFTSSLKPIYAAYFDAQKALAADNLAGFLQATGDLKAAIRFVEEAMLTGESRETWRHAASSLRVDGALTDIEVARERFKSMSKAVIALQEHFGHVGDETWHMVHCPMAFGFAGAEWIQQGTQINNPYFGASMLRCGEIRRALPPLAGEHANPEGHDHE